MAKEWDSTASEDAVSVRVSRLRLANQPVRGKVPMEHGRLLSRTDQSFLFEWTRIVGGHNYVRARAREGERDREKKHIYRRLRAVMAIMAGH